MAEIRRPEPEVSLSLRWESGDGWCEAGQQEGAPGPEASSSVPTGIPDSDLTSAPQGYREQC